MIVPRIQMERHPNEVTPPPSPKPKETLVFRSIVEEPLPHDFNENGEVRVEMPDKHVTFLAASGELPEIVPPQIEKQGFWKRLITRIRSLWLDKEDYQSHSPAAQAVLRRSVHVDIPDDYIKPAEEEIPILEATDETPKLDRAVSELKGDFLTYMNSTARAHPRSSLSNFLRADVFPLVMIFSQPEIFPLQELMTTCAKEFPTELHNDAVTFLSKIRASAVEKTVKRHIGAHPLINSIPELMRKNPKIGFWTLKLIYVMCELYLGETPPDDQVQQDVKDSLSRCFDDHPECVLGRRELINRILFYPPYIETCLAREKPPANIPETIATLEDLDSAVLEEAGFRRYGLPFWIKKEGKTYNLAHPGKGSFFSVNEEETADFPEAIATLVAQIYRSGSAHDRTAEFDLLYAKTLADLYHSVTEETIEAKKLFVFTANRSYLQKFLAFLVVCIRVKALHAFTGQAKKAGSSRSSAITESKQAVEELGIEGAAPILVKLFVGAQTKHEISFQEEFSQELRDLLESLQRKGAKGLEDLQTDYEWSKLSRGFIRAFKTLKQQLIATYEKAKMAHGSKRLSSMASFNDADFQKASLKLDGQVQHLTSLLQVEENRWSKEDREQAVELVNALVRACIAPMQSTNSEEALRAEKKEIRKLLKKIPYSISDSSPFWDLLTQRYGNQSFADYLKKALQMLLEARTHTRMLLKKGVLPEEMPSGVAVIYGEVGEICAAFDYCSVVGAILREMYTFLLSSNTQVVTDMLETFCFSTSYVRLHSSKFATAFRTINNPGVRPPIDLSVYPSFEKALHFFSYSARFNFSHGHPAQWQCGYFETDDPSEDSGERNFTKGTFFLGMANTSSEDCRRVLRVAFPVDITHFNFTHAEACAFFKHLYPVANLTLEAFLAFERAKFVEIDNEGVLGGTDLPDLTEVAEYVRGHAQKEKVVEFFSLFNRTFRRIAQELMCSLKKGRRLPKVNDITDEVIAFIPEMERTELFFINSGLNEYLPQMHLDFSPVFCNLLSTAVNCHMELNAHEVSQLIEKFLGRCKPLFDNTVEFTKFSERLKVILLTEQLKLRLVECNMKDFEEALTNPYDAALVEKLLDLINTHTDTDQSFTMGRLRNTTRACHRRFNRDGFRAYFNETLQEEVLKLKNIHSQTPKTPRATSTRNVNLLLEPREVTTQ